mgnify:CR=1 FL=1
MQIFRDTAYETSVDLAREKQQTIAHNMEQRSLGTLGDLLDLYIADLEQDEKRTAKEVKIGRAHV